MLMTARRGVKRTLAFYMGYGESGSESDDEVPNKWRCGRRGDRGLVTSRYDGFRRDRGASPAPYWPERGVRVCGLRGCRCQGLRATDGQQVPQRRAHEAARRRGAGFCARRLQVEGPGRAQKAHRRGAE